MILMTAPIRFGISRTSRASLRGSRCCSSRRKPSVLRLFGSDCRNLKRRGSALVDTKASLITNPDDFAVGRYVGEYGFMNVTSYSGLSDTRNIGAPSIGYSSEDIEKIKIQDVGEGKVKIRLYEGKVVQGSLKGTRVIFKVYPGRRACGIEADMMAANELNCHASLQNDLQRDCENIQILLGGFETRTGEQWLAFRNDGTYSAADYAKVASERISKDRASTKQSIWAAPIREGAMKRRRFFVIKLLNRAINGLAFMHDHDRLHQSIGPASILLNTISEGETAYLVPRLRDLAFSVDISTISEGETAYLVPRLRDLAFSVDIRYASLEAGIGGLSDGLWRRASLAGARTTLEKRAFGIADDIYEAGLLFVYLAFVPFCEAGVVDGLSMRRFFESTFQLDLGAAREYFSADDRMQDAVSFLNLGDGAGWELLQVRPLRKRFGYPRLTVICLTLLASLVSYFHDLLRRKLGFPTTLFADTPYSWDSY